jgi:ADP-dependent NAD(P)H-hydrate dehydratase / NAD(P)H-hydrate epimerase
MMMYLVTAEQMQEMDRQAIKSFGIPGLVLMENAARGSFEMLKKKFGSLDTKKIAVLSGRGNNGGDGFVMARYLMEMGVNTTTFLLSSKDKVKGDAKVNLTLLEKLCLVHKNSYLVEIPDTNIFNDRKAGILHSDIIIDAILGTGLKSNVRGFFKNVIQMLNNSKKPVFSVDIPSGLNSDTGQPCGIAVKATATATFAFTKAGHILYPGNMYTGDLEVIDIGIPNFIAKRQDIRLSLLERHKIATLFEPRHFLSHKGRYGHLMTVAGSAGKTGAAALCSNAAARCGTGLVTLGVANSLNARMEPQVTEAMTFPLPEKTKGCLDLSCLDEILALSVDKSALAIGPGLGTRIGTEKLVEKLVTHLKIPMVIDADGLNCISNNPDILKTKKAPAVLTPHPGEMARLCGVSTEEIQENRLDIARTFSKQFNSILVLKGAQTLISLPNQNVFISPTGNPGMASGGMGDVLTGMIAGFTAQGFSPETAALAGVYIHGMCADSLARQTGAFGFLASDMVEIIPKIIHKELL